MIGSSSNKKKIKTDKGNCKLQRQSLCQRSHSTCSILALSPHWGPMLVLASRKQRHLHGAKPSTSRSNWSWRCLQTLQELVTVLVVITACTKPFWNKAHVMQSRREPFALGQVLWAHGLWHISEVVSMEFAKCQLETCPWTCFILAWNAFWDAW